MTLTAERRYRDLFEPADRAEWTLPQEITVCRERSARLAAAYTRAAAPLLPSREAVHDDAVRAALAVDDPAAVDLAALVDHPRRAAERDARTGVLRIASERADAALAGAVSGLKDQLITGHLRVAGEALWTAAVKATKALGDIDIDQPNELLRAPDKTRNAWLELDDLAARYGRIREAMSRLLLHLSVTLEHDTDGDHAEFREGYCTLAGPQWKGLPMAERRPKLPWPSEPRPRVVWFARKGIKPWWPTIAERDEAWMAAHREAFERIQKQRQLNRTAQDWGVSVR